MSTPDGVGMGEDKRPLWERVWVLGVCAVVIGLGLAWWNHSGPRTPAAILDTSGGKPSTGWTFDPNLVLGEPMFPTLSVTANGRDFGFGCDSILGPLEFNFTYGAQMTGDPQRSGQWSRQVAEPLLTTANGPIAFEDYAVAEPNDDGYFLVYYSGVKLQDIVALAKAGGDMRVEVVGEPTLGGTMSVGNLGDVLGDLVRSCRMMERQDRIRELRDARATE